MLFDGHTYRTLIVSSSDKTTDFLRQLLPGGTFQPLDAVSGAGDARRLLLNTDYDLVLINGPLADETGIELAGDAMERGGAGVLLLVRGEHYEAIASRVTPQGVFALAKPTNGQAVFQAVCLLCAMRERLRVMEQRNRSLRERMEEIRLVNRAKWALIGYLKMSESEAHRFLEKQAMDMRISKREAAENILRTYEK